MPLFPDPWQRRSLFEFPGSTVAGPRQFLTSIIGSLQSWNSRVRPCLVLRNRNPLASWVVHRVSGHLSSCIWNLRLFLEDSTGVSVSLHVVTSSSGLHSKRCPGIGTYLECTRKSVSFGMWHDPRGFLLSLNVRPASSWGATGRSGSVSRQSRGIDLYVEIRRGKGAQIKLCWETLCSSRVRSVCQGTFWVASRVSSTISNFKREPGISLEKLQWERASSRDDGGTSWFFSSWGRILGLWRGTQGASRVAPGKSNLHWSCERELGIALESLQGK